MQAKTSILRLRSRPRETGRTRQRPARLDDCKVNLPSQRSQERLLPEHIPEEYNTLGKPVSIFKVAEIGGNYRCYLKLYIINTW